MVYPAQKRASKKYDKAHCEYVSLKLNKKYDKDIVEFLEGANNKQGLLKKVIREHIKEKLCVV